VESTETSASTSRTTRCGIENPGSTTPRRYPLPEQRCISSKSGWSRYVRCSASSTGRPSIRRKEVAGRLEDDLLERPRVDLEKHASARRTCF